MATAYTAGETLTAGQVVRLDTSADNTVELITATTDKVIGIVSANTTSAATAIIDTNGSVSITVTGSVTRGDYLEPSATTGSAQSASTTRTTGTFAIASTGDSGGSVTAELLTDGIDSVAVASHVHAASVITNTPAGDIAATDVQAAIDELDTEKSGTAHVHAASAITNTPAGDIAATDVQAAIDELDTEKSATGHAHAGADITSGVVARARGALAVDSSGWTDGLARYTATAANITDLSGLNTALGSTIQEFVRLDAVATVFNGTASSGNFDATINGAPAGQVVTYTIVSNEDYLTLFEGRDGRTWIQNETRTQAREVSAIDTTANTLTIVGDISTWANTDQIRSFGTDIWFPDATQDESFVSVSNIVPSTAVAINLSCQVKDSNVTGSNLGMILHGPTDAEDASVIAMRPFAQVTNIAATNEAMVPLDSSQRFRVTWNSSGAATMQYVCFANGYWVGG